MTAKRWLDGNILSFVYALVVPVMGCNILVMTDSPGVTDWFHEGHFTSNPYLPFLQSNEHRIAVTDDLSKVINKSRLVQLDVMEDFSVLIRVWPKSTQIFTVCSVTR